MMWTALVTDLFGRTHESWHAHLDGMATDRLLARPGPDANPVGWLAWHALRVQDDHLAGLAGRDQVWHEGWAERFDLPYDRDATGYGQDSDEVAAFRGDAATLLGYADAVHARTLEIVESLDDADLERVVDDSYDPPVTLAVRLVSVVDDVAQHVGQAGYVVGLLDSR